MYLYIFIIIGSIGLFLFLLSVFGGGDHDFDSDMGFDGDSSQGQSDGIGLFSYRTLVTFLTAFGAAGAIGIHSGFSVILSSMIGVIAGVIFGLFTWWLMKQAFKQQASSLVTTVDLIGKIGVVNVSIIGDHLGEISVEVKGQRKAYHSKSKSGDIKEGSSVRIVSDAGVFLIVEPV
jgi:membrane protein implicated in regulation of membrane protease activity